MSGWTNQNNTTTSLRMMWPTISSEQKQQQQTQTSKHTNKTYRESKREFKTKLNIKPKQHANKQTTVNNNKHFTPAHWEKIQFNS
jgi:hypothetical protein